MSSSLDSVKNTDKIAFQDMRVSDQATEALRRDAISDEGFGKLGGSGSSSGNQGFDQSGQLDCAGG